MLKALVAGVGRMLARDVEVGDEGDGKALRSLLDALEERVRNGVLGKGVGVGVVGGGGLDARPVRWRA